jgi:DNA polymerase-3 subunit epsilon
MKPFVTIDCETTGTDPATDRIISFAAHKRLPAHVSKEWRFNPGVPIRNSDIHGITDHDVAHLAPFNPHFAREIVDWIGPGTTLVGYNLLKFDIPIFIAELARCGSSIVWPEPGAVIIDSAPARFRSRWQALRWS